MGQVIENGEKQAHFDEKPEQHLPKRFELKAEFPFSSDLKRMSMIYLDQELEGRALVVIKGAVSCLPPFCAMWRLIFS